MAIKQGIRGIRQSIPSGYMIGRQSPGSSKGAPGLIPLPPLNQQPIIAGSGGKATQGGGQGGGGSSSAAIVTITAGTGINVTGAPAYTVSLQVPVTVADGGTNATTASGTSLDNITGFSATGYLKRTGAGTYSFVTDGTAHQVLHGGGTFSQVDLTADVTGVLPVANGGTNASSASGTALDNITGFSSTGILKRTGAGTYTFIANGQLPATATNDNATAGNVGEYVSSVVLFAGLVVLTSTVASNITSISLTAGDWDVWGEIWLNLQPTTVLDEAAGDVSLTSATGPSTPSDGQARGMLCHLDAGLPSTAASVLSIAPCRASLAGTTTYYLNVNASFSVSTIGAFGKLCARRVR